MRMWETLLAGGVIEEFGRPELRPRAQGPLPPQDMVGELFKEPPAGAPEPEDLAPSQASAEVAPSHDAAVRELRRFTTAADRADFREWRGEQDGVLRHSGYTPESEQELMAERLFLRHLHENEDWARCDDSVAILMPAGELVRRRADGATFFVVKAYKAAALLWPARPLAVRLWERDLEAPSLEWVVVLSLDDWEDIPTEVFSPFGCHLEDSPRRARRSHALR